MMFVSLQPCIPCGFWLGFTQVVSLHADTYGSREVHFFWTSSARVHSDSRRSSSTDADRRRLSPIVAACRRLSPIRDRNIRATKKKFANALWPTCAKRACEKLKYPLSRFHFWHRTLILALPLWMVSLSLSLLRSGDRSLQPVEWLKKFPLTGQWIPLPLGGGHDTFAGSIVGLVSYSISRHQV